MGYRNDVLASRLYNMLAEKQRLKRVYLPTFLIKLRGLVEGSAMEMNMFAFNIPANKVSIGAYSQNYNVVWHQNKDDYLWAVPLNQLSYGSKI